MNYEPVLGCSEGGRLIGERCETCCVSYCEVDTVRRALWSLAVCATLAAMAVTPAGAQTLRGLVLEEATEAPIALGRVVMVTLEGDSVQATLTDEQGFFSIDAGEAGRYVLVISALGYRTTRSDRVELESGEVRITQMYLSLRPIPVAGVDVTTFAPDEVEIPELAQRGFYDRMRAGWGEFLTAGQIRVHGGAYTPQLFREMITVELVPDRGRGSGPWSDRVVLKMDSGSRWVDSDGRLGAGMCEPAIWVDEVLTPLMPGENLDDVAPKETIEGVEVHRAGFGAPIRYFQDNSASACGAILIWTNRQ